ncbi:hypothetical protein [Roseomonas sp. BN140053]|uniref:hypothetical protein n=1 Tax=Roseomonas sp. BN140053 TaxID=3391898 RepID=UPI0039E85875
MSTLLLGEFGRGDLAGEAALLHAAGDPANRGPGSSPLLVATDDPEGTLRLLPGAVPVPPNTPTPESARRAALCGPQADIGRAADLVRRLGVLAEARGLRIGLSNLSFHPWGPLYRPEPTLRAVLERLDWAGARDHRTLGAMVEWRPSWWPSLDAYPEAVILPELPEQLPPGPRLGLAIRDGAKPREAHAAHAAAIEALCAPYDGWTVVPLPVVRNEGVDDLRAIRDFAARFLPNSPVADTVPESPAEWRRAATPQRLKGWVASCDAAIAGRELVIAFAAAAGVPCLALAPHADDEAGRAAGTLANRLAPGSRYRVLPS